MDRETLRSVQQPLKDRYRNEPEAAVVTLRAEGALGEGVTCSVQTGRALVEAGLHEASGGTGASVCSGDMLLQALVACAGVTLNSVATSMEIPIARGTVFAEGDLDFRGTMAVSRDAPVGFTAIRLSFTLSRRRRQRSWHASWNSRSGTASCIRHCGIPRRRRSHSRRRNRVRTAALRSLRVKVLAFVVGWVGGSCPIPRPHQARRDGERDRGEPRRGQRV